MFMSLALTTVLLAIPPVNGDVEAARAETKLQAIVALINGLLADPRFRLFEAVFPQDSGAVLIALAPPDPPGFASCIQGAVAVCGAGNVCSVCFVNTPQQTICSFICGNPGEPMGCQPQSPCPPTPKPGDTEPPTPMPINPQE